MRDQTRRPLPFLLSIFFLLAVITCVGAEESSTWMSTDSTALTSSTTAQPSTAYQVPEAQQPGFERLSRGADLVERALSILRRLDPKASNRHSRRSSGLFGTAINYAKILIPGLYISGPPVEHTDNSGRERQALVGPLADGVALLREASKLHNSDAIYLLAEMSFYGNFTHPKNYTEAFQWYMNLASQDGNSSAQHMIGFMYATGIGNAVERDQAKALLYHTFAAVAGHTKSQMIVAFRHHAGIGTRRNCDEAARYYKKVADKAMEWVRSGPPGGRVWVPDSYRLADDVGGVYGEGASVSSAGANAPKGGVNSDAHAALDDVLEYLDLMSSKGDFKATFSLGRILYDGQKGLARDLRSAKRYFQTVAYQYWKRDGTTIDVSDKPGLEKFACKSAGYLGRMFLRGEGVDQSYKKALNWFTRGIKNGDAGSQDGLGLMYLHGFGVPQNTVKASELFKAAADQDYAPAQVHLGVLYLDEGQANDVAIATRYFELAARYSNMEAFYYLAEIVGQGIGRDRSCGLATAYYKSVAEKAEPLLSSFSEANEAFTEGDYELALVDYMMAAEQGYEKGQANVAYLLDQQKSMLTLPSVPQFSSPKPSLLRNSALALIYWTRSAKQTNIDSMVKMGDYYLNGIGTQADMEKAAACYMAASEFHQSAQALYNLGWMHENGKGLTQDFHLAKRYYDQALETNEEAYLPVTLSLLKLRARSAWNTLTRGRINSIRDEPGEEYIARLRDLVLTLSVTQKKWSIREWVRNFMRDDQPYAGYDDDDDDLLPRDPMPGGDEEGLYDDLIDDGIIETFIIIGLAATLIWLIYYRGQRQLAHRQLEEAARAQAAGQQPPQPDRGVFPNPGDPAFPEWVAGGIGH